ncbi:Serine-protein kinase ATM [Chionoecetes opilio]|uniref:Serine-protein kinase ATM n=1 Tax=Chionoecetes opilio TaxID=41210 RepID=A0A8J4Y3N2_CHIOP|nr:Serine-protein kinase ATM [Chionoecetes opilio]
MCDASHRPAGLRDALASLGLYNTLAGVLHSPQPGGVQWEAAWRLCRWEEDGGPGVARGVGEGGLQQHVFGALRCLHHQDLQALHQHTTTARRTITHTLSLGRAESTSLVQPILTKLQVLNEIEEAAQCLAHLTSPERVRGCALDLEAGWRAKEDMGCVKYKHKEEVMAARVSILKALTGGCQEELQGILHRTLVGVGGCVCVCVRECV